MMKNLLIQIGKTVADWSQPLLPFVDASNRDIYDQLGLFEKDPLPADASHLGKNSAEISGEKLGNERESTRT